MSEESTPQTGSAAPQSASDSPGAAKQPRSPMERCIVWGGIIVLILLVGYQAHARLGYTMTLNRLEPLIDDDYEGGEPLAIADVDSHVVGFPSQTENSVSEFRTERVYRWKGLTSSYGITLAYNPQADSPVVISLVTDDAPVPEPESADEDMAGMEEADAEDTGGGPDGRPGGGPGGGGPPMHVAEGGGPGGGGPSGGGRFNPMENDADGDGKLSRDEAPGRMAENFEELDTNSDGFIDESEIETMRERFRERRGEGGDRPDRPQRPSSDDTEGTAAPDAGNDASPAANSESPDTNEKAATETPPAAETGETQEESR